MKLLCGDENFAILTQNGKKDFAILAQNNKINFAESREHKHKTL